MTPEEAVRFLNEDVAWEPGLKVSAGASTLAPDSIHVMFTRTVQDSSVILPDGTYPPAPCRHDVRPADVHDLFADRYPADFSFAVQPQSFTPKMIPVTIARMFSGYELESREVLLRHVIKAVTEMHQHDIREFTRVRGATGKWTAPFHPHRQDGERLWKNGGREVTAAGQ